jgi:glycosyltransferase involved in cell wall biosynthesis
MIARLPLSASPHPSTTAQPHILLILDGFPQNLGGGERIALRLAELLPRHGFQASVLALAIHPQSPVLSLPLPFPVYHLPLTRTYDLTALRAALALGSLLRRQNVQIVQTFFESSDLWAGLVTRTLTSARLIWSRRDMGILRSPKHAHAYRLLRRLPHLVLAVSDQVRQHAIECDRIPPERVRTLYNGIDVFNWARPADLPPTTRLHVTTIGNIRRVKGHDLFIRAAALIRQHIPAASFSIVGQPLETAYYSELQSLIADLNLFSHFQLLPATTNLREHLNQAAVFILPSRSEGFSNAILEAMASALPVVATNVGGNAEAVLDQGTGFLVPPEDPAALAQAVVRLLLDPALRDRMGLAGELRARSLFSTGTMMEQLAAAFRKLLQP